MYVTEYLQQIIFNIYKSSRAYYVEFIGSNKKKNETEYVFDMKINFQMNYKKLQNWHFHEKILISFHLNFYLYIFHGSHYNYPTSVEFKVLSKH